MTSVDYDTEVNKCLATGIYTYDDCGRFGRCVVEDHYYAVELCGMDEYGTINCNDNDPLQLALTESYCYSTISPITVVDPPGEVYNPIEDPPATLPPDQEPPCDPYYDMQKCKHTKTCCLI